MKGYAFGDQQIWSSVQNNEDKPVHTTQSQDIMNHERDVSEKELNANLESIEREIMASHAQEGEKLKEKATAILCEEVKWAGLFSFVKSWQGMWLLSINRVRVE